MGSTDVETAVADSKDKWQGESPGEELKNSGNQKKKKKKNLEIRVSI